MQALLVPFIETTMGPVRPLLQLIMGAVCLVLLLACGNLASMLMARAADRVHDMGVRTALGAQRSRLVRLMLSESVMLSMAGGALAVPLDRQPRIQLRCLDFLFTPQIRASSLA